MKGNRQNSIINKFTNKLFQRSMVFILLISFLMTAMPVYAISSSNTPELNETIGTNIIDNNTIISTETSSTATTPTKLTDKDNVYISVEEVSRRGEFEKHYLLSDGSFVAVTYPEAVHYKNDDGEWEEVDNQLSYDSKTSRIVNGQNGFAVSFAEKPSGNSLASLLHDGKAFSWTLSASKKLDSGKETKLTAFSASIATIIQEDKVELASNVSRASVAETSVIGKKVTDTDAFTNDKLSGKLGYAKLFNDAPEISVDYSVYHNKIEEDIYINSATDLRSFSMEIQANGLTAIVNDDGSVDFVDADGMMQYRIGIPYMQDANHEVLNDIEVTATLNGDVWTVTYTPDEEWLTSEERAYPILLDPSVTTKEYNSNIIDTYVYEGNTANHSSEQHMYIGVKSGKIHRTYVKVQSLPSIDDTSPILGATMQLSFASGTTTGKTAQVYKASYFWNPSTLTYANQPALISSNLLSTCDYNSSIQSLAFDITADIAKLYTEVLAEPNYGYVVKYADESNVNPDYNMFCSMEHTNVANRPVITVNYGYVLPSTLMNGGVYAFQNYETDRFMAVDSGTDANDVNVITEWVPEDEITYELENRHYFKLEYIPSTGAYYLRAMCSSNGTNRVLDVVKYNGYPDYGSNVQIYNPTDPLAQHWLIIATGNNRCKIVLRNAPGLLLSEDIPMENVELRSYEDEWYQEWTIYDDDGHPLDINPQAVLIGVSNADHDHSSALYTITTNLGYCGYNNVNIYTGEFTTYNIDQYLDSNANSVFVSRSHGGPVLTINDVQVGTCIILNDDRNNQVIYTSYGSITDLDLSNMKLIMFIACSTAIGGAGGKNLPTVAVEQGALTSVGFKDEIYCGMANNWTKDFFALIDCGYTVEDVCYLLADDQYWNTCMESYEICGNKHTTLC